jgi:hypothetical protein
MGQAARPTPAWTGAVKLETANRGSGAGKRDTLKFLEGSGGPALRAVTFYCARLRRERDGAGSASPPIRVTAVAAFPLGARPEIQKSNQRDQCYNVGGLFPRCGGKRFQMALAP